MGNLSAVDCHGVVSKGKVKSHLRKNLYPSRPDLMQKVGDKIIIKSLIFISGYIKCLEHHVKPPINTEEFDSLLMREISNWIVEYVDGGGH
jgi:hypothetical protein